MNLYFLVPNKKIWTPRKKRDVIGRIITASPIEGERFYLRLLLTHVRGPTSFDALRCMNGTVSSTFCKAALSYGLLEGDDNYASCLEEATLYKMPYELRHLFATVLAFCDVSDPKSLWEKYKTSLCEDYIRDKSTLFDIELMALQSIHMLLEPMGKNINDYALVAFHVDVGLQEKTTKMLDEELHVEISSHDLQAPEKLKDQQKIAFDMILSHVFSGKGGLFFIDGPGGIGKTFLYHALLAAVRSRKLIALATASCGVAAGILPGGRTAHSRFKIPLQLDENVICSVSKQSALANLLRMTELIIWDEAPMAHRFALEAVDRMLQDINECTSPFGGKVVVCSGDFRQVLPVVPKAAKQDVLKASLVNSYLWKKFIKIEIVENMRARSDPWFSDYLVRIGDGVKTCDSLGKIQLPLSMVLPYTNDTSLRQLTGVVFPNINVFPENLSSMINRVILTPKNDCVDQINALLMDLFPGDVVRYFSFDEPIDKLEYNLQQEILNSLVPNGIPPHELILKKNCPIILLRNINPAEGLCNGTMLICRQFERNVIDAEIAVG